MAASGKYQITHKLWYLYFIRESRYYITRYLNVLVVLTFLAFVLWYLIHFIFLVSYYTLWKHQKTITILFLFYLKRLWHRCFLVNFAKFLGTPFFIGHLWWLLLRCPWRATVLFHGFLSSVLRIWHSSRKCQTVLGNFRQFSEVSSSSQKL